jgi:hypothetical protein
MKQQVGQDVGHLVPVILQIRIAEDAQQQHAEHHSGHRPIG